MCVCVCVCVYIYIYIYIYLFIYLFMPLRSHCVHGPCIIPIHAGLLLLLAHDELIIEPFELSPPAPIASYQLCDSTLYKFYIFLLSIHKL